MHLPSTVARAIFAAAAGIPPPPHAAAAEPFDHAYGCILAPLLENTKGQYTSPLSASCAIPASRQADEWLAWLPEGLAPLGMAQPL